MHQSDRDEYIKRYETRLRKFGYSPETLGWGKGGRQNNRFSVLAQPALANSTGSVLDIGCGFADLLEFLVAQGWRGSYTGVDLVPAVVKVAQERHPGHKIFVLDVSEDVSSIKPHDHVIASGVLNARLKSGDNLAYSKHIMRTMFGLARKTLSIDFLSTHVDFQASDAWHIDPHWACEVVRELSPRFVMRCDYMPYEFALLIYCDDRISPRNVFPAYEAVAPDWPLRSRRG